MAPRIPTDPAVRAAPSGAGTTTDALATARARIDAAITFLAAALVHGEIQIDDAAIGAIQLLESVIRDLKRAELEAAGGRPGLGALRRQRSVGRPGEQRS